MFTARKWAKLTGRAVTRQTTYIFTEPRVGHWMLNPSFPS